VVDGAGLARHQIEAPGLPPGLRVVSGHIPAQGAEVLAREPDDDLAVECTWSAGNDRAVVAVYGLHAPQQLAIGGIQSQQPAIDRPGIHAALPEGQAADAPVESQLLTRDIRRVRVVPPEEFAADRLDGIDNSVTGADVDNATDLQGCRNGVGDIQVERPGEAQPADIGGIDLRQRTEVPLAERSAVRRPVAPVLLVRQRRVVDRCARRACRARCSGGRQRKECNLDFYHGARLQQSGEGKEPVLNAAVWQPAAAQLLHRSIILGTVASMMHFPTYRPGSAR
jgi:hypothetical protein